MNDPTLCRPHVATVPAADVREACALNVQAEPVHGVRTGRCVAFGNVGCLALLCAD